MKSFFRYINRTPLYGKVVLIFENFSAKKNCIVQVSEKLAQFYLEIDENWRPKVYRLFKIGRRIYEVESSILSIEIGSQKFADLNSEIEIPGFSKSTVGLQSRELGFISKSRLVKVFTDLNRKSEFLI